MSPASESTKLLPIRRLVIRTPLPLQHGAYVNSKMTFGLLVEVRQMDQLQRRFGYLPRIQARSAELEKRGVDNEESQHGPVARARMPRTQVRRSTLAVIEPELTLYPIYVPQPESERAAIREEPADFGMAVRKRCGKCARSTSPARARKRVPKLSLPQGLAPIVVDTEVV